MKPMAKRASKRSTSKKPTKGIGRGKAPGSRKARALTEFKPGERRTGRTKGTKNKLGVQIKEALLTALEKSGRDGKGKDGAVGYFVWLSRNEPAVFGGLVGKILPMQLEVKDKTDRYTPAQAVERLKERGLPVPESLNNLATSVGRAVAERQEQDYEDELNGVGHEASPDDPDDDDEFEDDEEDAENDA